MFDLFRIFLEVRPFLRSNIFTNTVIGIENKEREKLFRFSTRFFFLPPPMFFLLLVSLFFLFPHVEFFLDSFFSSKQNGL